MRDLAILLTQMIRNIPSQETRLLNSLNRVLDSLRYAAPEIQPEYWRRVQDILNEALIPAQELWKLQVLRQWRGQ